MVSTWLFRAGGELMDVEFTQFHPTGMVWPPAVHDIEINTLLRRTTDVPNRVEGANPFLLHQELQDLMQKTVGMVRSKGEREEWGRYNIVIRNGAAGMVVERVARADPPEDLYRIATSSIEELEANDG